MSNNIPWDPSIGEEAVAKEIEALDRNASDAPRRGSALEGRVRSLLQSKGYRAITNKIVLDHEIDVWGEDNDGRIALVECKEYYTSGPISSGQIRNFFGKIYDIEHNYGENVYLKMFVSISGFTDPARSLCERLGILAIDNNALEILELSKEELVPARASLEDQTVIELRKERDKLQDEIIRRNLVRKLGQQIDDFNKIIQTKTLPSFLVPSAVSNSFWYSAVQEIPFVGLNGIFRNFTCPLFPRITHVLYEQRRLFGKKIMSIPIETLRMKSGIIYIEADDIRTIITTPPEDAYPYLEDLINVVITTPDNKELGKAIDLMVAYRMNGWFVESVKVHCSDYFRDKLSHPEFSIPSERISLRETSSGWNMVAHVKVASEIAASR